MHSNAFFNTHHAPVGAWASLTFGAPGLGVSIDLQEPNVKKSGALMAGVADKTGLHTIAFAELPKQVANLTAEGDEEKKKAAMLRNPLAAYGVYGEEELTRTLGTRVQINGGEKRGKIVIEYYNEEDLERLYELLSR